MSINLVEQGYVTVEEMQRRSRLSDEALHQAILDLESVGLIKVLRSPSREVRGGNVPAFVRRAK